MTTFVLSHNLQVQSDLVPALNFELLAQELKSISSDLSPQDMAIDLVRTWSEYRRQLGHDMNHVVLALGGRKDSQASPGAPLQEGYWGVDLVETPDESTFLQAINWEALKAGRPEDAIFEVSSRAS